MTTGKGTSKTLVGTTIYAPAGSPVIAAQDGEVEQVGVSPSLGRYVTLRDAYGNTYTYARLGDLQRVYPVIEPRVDSKRQQPSSRAAPREPAPSGPATAGVQPRSPVSEGATVSGLALGAAAGLEAPPAVAAPTQSPAPAPAQPTAPATVAPHVQAFREGSNEVYLHQLHPGVQVIAGTVLGHVGAGSGGEEPHIVFQIRPAGPDAPLIDPKPVLDGWVALENSSVFHAKGENPFLATSPTVGPGAARVKAAARAAGAARQRHPPEPLRPRRTSSPAASTSACWRRSSTCRSRA